MRLRRILAVAATTGLLTVTLGGASGADEPAQTTAGPAAVGLEDWFTQHPLTVNGDYIPLLGSFCLGDGSVAQVFWYAPGPAPDYTWTLDFQNPGSGIVSKPAAPVNGTYQPLVGDFDGNVCNDIIWYGPGSAPDAIWWGGVDGWTAQPLTINGHYQPMALTAGFDVDCLLCNNVFWYSTDGGKESIWLGRPGQTFDQGVAPQVSYSGYRTSAFGSSILFHRPGPGQDYLWHGVWGQETLPLASQPLTIDGTYEPYMLGVLSPLLYAPGPATDRFVTSITPESVMTVVDGTINGTYRVGRAPHFQSMALLFHGPGTAPDSLWVYTGPPPD